MEQRGYTLIPPFKISPNLQSRKEINSVILVLIGAKGKKDPMDKHADLLKERRFGKPQKNKE